MSKLAGQSQRGFERELVRTETLVVEGRVPDGHALSGRSQNLSLSGIFVETKEPLLPGTEVQLFIGSLSSSFALRVVAQVVRNHTDGFGARFVDESEEGRSYVAAFIKRFRKKG